MNSNLPKKPTLWHLICKGLQKVHHSLPDPSFDPQAMKRPGFKLFLHGVVVSFETGPLDKVENGKTVAPNPALPRGQ